jgi:hypothetical protein
MDSGYPTREVVKTASPEMLVLAPKDLPSKIGPFLMVKVAGSFETDVALRLLGAGIARSVFGSTVARQRVWMRFFVTRPRRLADRSVEGLNICDNMVRGDTVCREISLGSGFGRLSVY